MTFESPTWQLGIDKLGKRLPNTHNLTELSKISVHAHSTTNLKDWPESGFCFTHPLLPGQSFFLGMLSQHAGRTNTVKAPYMKTNLRLPVYILVAAEFPGMLLTHPFKANTMKVRQEEILTGGTDKSRPITSTKFCP